MPASDLPDLLGAAAILATLERPWQLHASPDGYEVALRVEGTWLWTRRQPTAVGAAQDAVDRRDVLGEGEATGGE